MRGATDLLFYQADNFSVAQHQREHMQAEIANFDPNKLLNTNPDDLAAYFSEKYGVDAPILHEEQMTARECRVLVYFLSARDVRS